MILELFHFSLVLEFQSIQQFHPKSDRKAKFQVTMTAPSDRLVLSNTHEISSVDNGDGTKTTKFDTTPIMSTYLLAFIVGNYDQISEDVDGVKVPLFIFIMTFELMNCTLRSYLQNLDRSAFIRPLVRPI